MKKLWEKYGEVKLNKEIEAFDFGGVEAHPDNNLVLADVYGNMAQAEMLGKMGILTSSELARAKKGLLEVIKLYKSGKFKIEAGEEDIHTKVENFLTKNCGKVGEKIHTARSRNDQVVLDTRLYTKEKLLEAVNLVLTLCATLVEFAKKYEFVPIPGYTHMKKAMPSSVGLWAGSFVESLFDDLRSVKLAYELNDQSPLGSAASYGVPLPIDRKLTSDLLGFKKVQNNVLYCQNSRGKIEAAVIFSFCEIFETLSKLAEDILMFSAEEFGYLEVSKSFLTGSSIMPQKENFDVMEGIRGKAHLMYGYLSQTLSSISGLPSGYNKDTQVTKKLLMDAFDLVKPALTCADLTFNNLKVNKAECIKSLTRETFAAHATYLLVQKGIPFRQAYRKVGSSLNKIPIPDPIKTIKLSDHLGGTGNLGLSNLSKNLKGERSWWSGESNKFHKALKSLIGGESL